MTEFPRAPHKSRLFRRFLVLSGLSLGATAALGADTAILRIGERSFQPREIERIVAECGEVSPAVCLEQASFGVLLELEGAKRNLLGSSRLRRQRTALLQERLSAALGSALKSPSEAEIAAFLKENEREFSKPLRLHLWRVLLPTEERAKELIAKLNGKMQPEAWRNFCRAESLDKATHERGGELGMVWPDGTTDIPQLRAEPILYAAALPLADGEWVKEPIPESGRFAVVWRRDHLPPASAEPAFAREQSVRRLLAAAQRKSEDDLVASLRKRELHDYAPAHLDELHFVFEKMP